MTRGDAYRIAWNAKEAEEIESARRLPEWREFHKVCGEIDVYFDNYVRTKAGMTVRVYTTRPHPRLSRVVNLIYLCRGEGHDAVSASINGLKQSGGSSLRSSLAALSLQMAQLAEMT